MTGCACCCGAKFPRNESASSGDVSATGVAEGSLASMETSTTSTGFSTEAGTLAPAPSVLSPTSSTGGRCSSSSAGRVVATSASRASSPTSNPQPSSGASFQEFRCEGEDATAGGATPLLSASPSSSADLPHRPLPMWPSSLPFHFLAPALGSSFGSFQRVLVGVGGGARELAGSFHRPLWVRSPFPAESRSIALRPFSDVLHVPPEREGASPPASCSDRDCDDEFPPCSSTCPSRPGLWGGA